MDYAVHALVKLTGESPSAATYNYETPLEQRGMVVDEDDDAVDHDHGQASSPPPMVSKAHGIARTTQGFSLHLRPCAGHSTNCKQERTTRVETQFAAAHATVVTIPTS